VYLEPSYVQPVFTLRNEGSQQIVGSYSNPNIKVEDNLGNVYTVSWYAQRRPWDFTLKPGESHEIKGNTTIRQGDLTNKAVEWVLITVDGISSIENARWKVNVYH
jgi:hypothetical protein